MALDKRSSGVFIDGAGPFVRVSDPVTWTYVVTNTGNVTLTEVAIWDDNGTAGDAEDDFLVCDVGVLAPGAQSLICSASGVAVAGRYRNVGLAYGTPPSGLAQITAEDASSYYGAAPAVALQKLTNGVVAPLPPGPRIIAGLSVTWRYVITNTGNITLTSVIVSDDNGTPTVSSDDVAVCEVTDLGPGQVAECEHSGGAILGPYANVGRVIAIPLVGDEVLDTASAHYLGVHGLFVPLIAG
jgi:hypothetical protein